MTEVDRKLGLTWRTGLVLAVASALGIVMFCWPLLAGAPAGAGPHTQDAPLVFALVMPVLIAVVLAEMSAGGMDAKALALLGLLAAINAVLRPLGAGTGGIELVFFLLVLAGRVFGPGFGFVLGCTSLFASALLTAGVGPWLPFQMMISGWTGLVAGLLPGRTGRWGRRPIRGVAEIALLIGYAVVAAYAFGFLMDLWSWPYAIGLDTDLSYRPGAPIAENLHRFGVYAVANLSIGWNTGRAITNTIAIAVLGPAVLALLRRAWRRAAFNTPVRFNP